MSRNRTTFMACGDENAEEQKGWRSFLRSRPGLRISEDQYFPWHWSWLLLPTIDLPRQIILTSYAWIFPSLLFLIIFSCPQQLNRWPCHSLSHSLTHSVTHSLTFTFAIQRATLDTCDLWDIWSEWWGDMKIFKKISFWKNFGRFLEKI